MPPCHARGWGWPGPSARERVQVELDQERLLWPWTLNPPSNSLSARVILGFIGNIELERFYLSRFCTPGPQIKSLPTPERPQIVQRPDAFTHWLRGADRLRHL